MKSFPDCFHSNLLSSVLVFALVACTPPPAEPTVSKIETTTPNRQVTVVQHLQLIQSYLQQQFPGWRLAQPSDYSKSWRSFYDNSAVTQMAVTDVNDDQKTDYGLLLIKEDSVQLVVLLGADRSFTHWVAPYIQSGFSARQNNLEHCIMIEPPGQIDIAYPAIQSLMLYSNAFNLMQLEKRIAIYYYANKTMNVFKTQ